MSPILWVPELFPGGKRLGLVVSHSSPTSTELKNEWSCTSPPSYMPLRRGQGKLCLLLFFPEINFDIP